MDVLDRHQRLVTRYGWQVTGAEADAALAMLDLLKVRADDWRPETPYRREALSLSWAKIARTGRDVKDVLLARQMEWEGRVYDSDGFTLRQAVLAEDPYTGQKIMFEQAGDRAGFGIQLDHVVSVADAYRSGGHRWKIGGYSWPRLYNDAGNILAVSAKVNESKGDKTAAGWLPENSLHDFKKRFVILQIQVKTRYLLSVTEAEQAVMRRVLRR